MVRFKHRYLLCEILSEDPRCRQCIDERAVGAAAKDAVARAHGDYGLACCSISFTENRNQRYSCCFNTIHVGGTIRTCQKFLVQYNRKQLLLLLHNCTNEEERQSIQKSVLSCSLKEVEEEQSPSGDEEDDCPEAD
ncbi:ribonuclease P/MRP protein subunit POP5 isoform X2 [Emydura macquarii macquarii]|uniref:ribonuclease P/MRP protein subunit POP5 isoform X2 n=1 Tax=Emydura macquarii macquarii TaxID=1129001 RepID=UPI00352BCE6E